MNNEPRTYATVNDDTMPAVSRPQLPYKPGFLTQKWKSNLVKFGIWLALSLVLFFTGLGRYLGDLAYERGYPYSFLIWGGFSIVMFLVYSAITFAIDWKLENGHAYEHGIHSMSPVSVLGKWVRTTFVDMFGFFFIAMYILTMFYIPFIFDSNLAPGDHASANWWLWSGIASIILIPVYFQVRRLLLTILNFGVSRVVVSRKPANMAYIVSMSIGNFGLLLGMWVIFANLRLLEYPGWVGLGLLLSVGWVVLFVLMMLGQFKSRETQLTVAYALLVIIVTSWIGSFLYGMLGQSNDTIIIRFAFFTIISILIPVMLVEFVGAFKTTDIGEDRLSKIREICKRFSIIPLGVHTYELDGDNSVETRLFGTLMSYYIFIPAKLLDKPELYASVTKAVAKVKTLEGSVATIIRVALFTLSSIALWFLFDMAHQSQVFMWFSAETGDPLLVVLMMLVFGAMFGFIGTPLLGKVMSLLDKSSTAKAKTLIHDQIVDSYNNLEATANGSLDNADVLGDLYGNAGKLI